jgi:hypothetical protein
MVGQNFGFYEVNAQVTIQLEQHWLGTQETQCGRGLWTMTNHMDQKDFVKGQEMDSSIKG